MNNYAIARTLLRILVRQCCLNNSAEANRIVVEEFQLKAIANAANSASDTGDGSKEDSDKCGGFLCTGKSCKRTMNITPAAGLHALVYTLTETACEPLRVLLPALKQDPTWSSYLDRQQVIVDSNNLDQYIISLVLSMYFVRNAGFS